MRYRVSDEQFIEAVRTSLSIREVLTKLGMKAAGGNYLTTNQRIKRLKLDTSHFTGMLWSKGKKLGCKYPIEDYLSNKRGILSHELKLRLISENYFQHICSNCNQSEWLGNKIPLELDHIDGEHLNNTFTNLRLLCPNCHALTPNYRGRKKKQTK